MAARKQAARSANVAKKSNVPAKRTQAKPPAVYDYGADAGAGADDISGRDVLVPFVRTIQSNNPELSKRQDKFIEGAEEGMFFNVATRRLYPGDGGLKFYVATWDHYYGEFIPRDDGGGFVGQRAVDDPTVLELKKEQGAFGKLETKDGTELVETRAAVGHVAVDDGDPEPAVYAFSSTGITPFRQWLTAVRPVLKRGVPCFAIRNRLTLVHTSNKQGEFWKPQLLVDGDEPRNYLLPPDDPLFLAGRELRLGFERGTIRAAADQQDAGDPVDEEAPY